MHHLALNGRKCAGECSLCSKKCWQEERSAFSRVEANQASSAEGSNHLIGT